LEDLVSVEARTSAAEEEEKEGWKLPWWVIMLIVVLVLTLVVGGVWWFRKRGQKRRREHTKRFANELGNKEVRFHYEYPCFFAVELIQAFEGLNRSTRNSLPFHIPSLTLLSLVPIPPLLQHRSTSPALHLHPRLLTLEK